MEHDWRNPLQAIRLQAQALIRDTAGDEQRSTQLRRIVRSSVRLDQLIGDLLDVSAIELGRLRIQPEPVDIHRAVSDAIEHPRPALGPRPLRFEAQGPLPRVLVDPHRLEQILANLLENAAKFSAEDTPIDVGLRGEEGGVTLSVVDRGIGMSAEEQARLFDRFHQAKRARERKTGLGMGLFITKSLVEAHRGRIWVKSAPREGSTFFVWLPAA